jgi:hypothetical protein
MDPKSPQSYNLYAYVMSDPVNTNDPSGQSPMGVACSVTWGPAQTVDPDDMPSEYGNLVYNTPGALTCVYVSMPTIQPLFKNCGPGDQTNLLFIWENYDAAQTLSKATGVPTDWILAWAAAESGWGQSPAAVDNQNYFGQTTSNWPGSMSCQGLPKYSASYACFGDFFQSAQSALETVHYNWNFQGTTGITAAQILTAFNPTGQNNADAAAAFQAVGNSQAPGNASYGTNVADTIPGVDKRIDCLEQQYGLH